MCIENICRRCVGGAAALIHPRFQRPCCDLVFFAARRKSKKVRRSSSSTQTQSTHRCTYMTWTTTPMPDTASLSTAFSIAWEMVSNKSSGSCWQQSQVTHFTAGLTDCWTASAFFFSTFIKMHAVAHLAISKGWTCKTYHIWYPQRFTHAVHLLWTGATHDEIFCLHGAANQI